MKKEAISISFSTDQNKLRHSTEYPIRTNLTRPAAKKVDKTSAGRFANMADNEGLDDSTQTVIHGQEPELEEIRYT